MNHDDVRITGDGFFRPLGARPRRVREETPQLAAYAGDLREAHARELTPVQLAPAGAELVGEIERYLAFFAAVRNRRADAFIDPEETV